MVAGTDVLEEPGAGGAGGGGGEAVVEPKAMEEVAEPGRWVEEEGEETEGC